MLTALLLVFAATPVSQADTALMRFLRLGVSPALECSNAKPWTADTGQEVTLMASYAPRYCRKSDGTLVLMPPGAVILEAPGALSEAESTNVLQRSGELGAAPWGAQSASAVNAASFAPDGTETATRVSLPATMAGVSAVVAQAFTGTGAKWSGSVYLKAAPGQGGRTVYVSATNGAAWVRKACALTETWARCAWEGAVLTAGAWTFQVGVDLRDSKQLGQPAATFYAWGAQAEAQPWATSPIPTKGAPASRNASPYFISNPFQRIVFKLCAGGFFKPQGAWNEAGVERFMLGTWSNLSDNMFYLRAVGGRVEFEVGDSRSEGKKFTAKAALTGSSGHSVVGCVKDGDLAVYVDGASVPGEVSGFGSGAIANARAHRSSVLVLSGTAPKTSFRGWGRDIFVNATGQPPK